MPNLVEALTKTGVGGMTVYPVQGFGRQQGRGKHTLMSKMKWKCSPWTLKRSMSWGRFSEVTRHGKFGDGKVAILPVDDVIRIRSNT